MLQTANVKLYLSLQSLALKSPKSYGIVLYMLLTANVKELSLKLLEDQMPSEILAKPPKYYNLL